MDLVNFLIPKIEHFRMLGYWLLFLVALLESLAFVGIVIPGSTIVVFMGALAARGYLDLADLIWFAAVGAILGDGISYLLGKRGKVLFAENNRLFKRSYLERGEEFFSRHGGKSIFLGRFFGPLRAVIPFVAGISRMNPRQFYIWNILSAITWAFLHLTAGYLLGNAWNMIEVWSGRVGLFLASVFVFLVCTYLLERFILTKGKQILGWCLDSMKSLAQKIAAMPPVRSFMLRHPVFVEKLFIRLDARQFTGLPLTLMGIAFLYILLMFFGVVEDIVNHESIVSFDTHLANLLYAYRSESLVKVFLWITLLGKSQVVLIVALAVTVLFWIWDWKRYILPFWVSLSGSYLVTFLGKIVIHRQRPPEIGVYNEAFYSFPSGHAAAATAVYGFIAYSVIRHVWTWRNRLNLSFLAIVLIFAIGFSRLYLGVHFISDILGGYLLGSLWLIIGICFTELLAGREPENRPTFFSPLILRSVTAVLILFLAAFYVHTGMSYQPARQASAGKLHPLIVNDVIQGFESLRLPRYTESITAVAGKPLNVIVLTANDASLTATMVKAGMKVPDPVSIQSMANLASSFLQRRIYPAAPITHSFWNGEPNQLGFVKSAGSHTSSMRSEARFWNTRFSTPDGRRIYVGLVSRTDGFRWLAVPNTSPDIDTARGELRHDLQMSNTVVSHTGEAFVRPVAQEKHGKQAYFTDGVIGVIAIR